MKALMKLLQDSLPHPNWADDKLQRKLMLISLVVQILFFLVLTSVFYLFPLGAVITMRDPVYVDVVFW